MRINKDIPLGVGLLVLMVFLYYTSNGFVYAESSAVFPKIVIIAIAILSSILLVNGILKTVESRKIGISEKAGVSFIKRFGKPLLVYGMFVCYLLMFYFVNFFVATAIMLVGLMLYFGVRDWKPLVFIPVGFLTVTYFVFVNILGVNLL